MKFPLESASAASAALPPSIFLPPLPFPSLPIVPLLHPPPAEVKTDPIDRPVHRGIDAEGLLLVRE